MGHKNWNISRMECKGRMANLKGLWGCDWNISRMECKDNSEGVLIVF